MNPDEPQDENSNEQLDERDRIQLLASRIQLLFGFCTEFIPHIDLLERVAKGSGERESMAMSAAPILGATGLDYQEINFEWKLRRKRAEAILNLVKVLQETEIERKKIDQQKKLDAHHRAEINKIFGI